MRWLVFLMLISFSALVTAQPDTLWNDRPNAWSSTITINNYAFSDALIINPVVTADWKKLHLEGRYNYEDVQTLSLFAGYTIGTGGDFSLELTPMLGIAMGQTDGIIPALEMTLAYGAFEMYAETEYLMHLSGGDNFWYTWSEITYYPVDWLMIGLAGARTKLYETDLSVQRGFGLGYIRERWEITSYLMNIGFDEPFFYFSVAINPFR